MKQSSTERYLANIFCQYFFEDFCSTSKKCYKNFQKVHKKTPVMKSYFSKVAGFYRSSNQRFSVKKVVLGKVFAKFTGKHLCQRLWHKCLPVNLAEFLRTPFLQKTSRQLLLLLAFKKQPPEVFYEKKGVLENFTKFTEKHLRFVKFSRTPFLKNEFG